jgi:hypothetical protein
VVYAALSEPMSIDADAGGPGRGAASLLGRNLDVQVRVTAALSASYAVDVGHGDASQVTERRPWWTSFLPRWMRSASDWP